MRLAIESVRVSAFSRSRDTYRIMTDPAAMDLEIAPRMTWQGAPRDTVVMMNDLRRGVPALEPLYVEPHSDNRGELLPHVLMGAIASFAAAATRGADRDVWLFF